MSNSSLVNYTHLTNKCNPRNHKIDTVTIHCYVGQITAKSGCDYLATTNRKASTNYVIGHDGSIGLNVEENKRAWTSSSPSNDHRAVTIEVASDTKEPYAITDKAYSSLISLLTDICKRNDIKKLIWSNDKNTRVNHLNGCNMTCHRDFANKSCPGTYIYQREGKIADEVNRRLGITSNNVNKSTDQLYRVRKTWSDSKSQIGAFKSLQNAKNMCDKNPGYSVFDSNGKNIYSNDTEGNEKNHIDIDALAYAVIRGEYGNGQERVEKLGSLYDSVQKRVNEILRK